MPCGRPAEWPKGTRRRSVALAARLRDAQTDEVIRTLADLEAQQGAPATVKSMTWYGQSKSIIEDWSVQFVKASNRKPGEVIEDTKPFTLKAW